MYLKCSGDYYYFFVIHKKKTSLFLTPSINYIYMHITYRIKSGVMAAIDRCFTGPLLIFLCLSSAGGVLALFFMAYDAGNSTPY